MLQTRKTGKDMVNEEKLVQDAYEKENARIVEKLRSEKTRQWLFDNWKGETELFDLLETIVRDRT